MSTTPKPTPRAPRKRRPTAIVPPNIPPATDEEVERHRRWAAIDYDAILARQVAEDEELVRRDREREQQEQHKETQHDER